MKIMITESKKNKLAGYTEEILHLAGKMMQCVEALDYSDEDMGERRYYGHRMGMRGMEDYPMGERSDYGDYGERRGVRGTGPYSRFY